MAGLTGRWPPGSSPPIAGAGSSPPMSPPDSVVERSSSPPNPFGVKLRAVAKVAFMAEAEVKAKEIIAVKEKAEADYSRGGRSGSGGCREGCQGAGAG